MYLPSAQALAKAGITDEHGLSRARENMRQILKEHPGECFDQDLPDMVGFDGDLAADRALFYVQTLPEGLALFIDTNLALVVPFTPENAAQLVILAQAFARSPEGLTHPLSSVPHIFRNGEVQGGVLSIPAGDNAD